MKSNEIKNAISIGRKRVREIRKELVIGGSECELYLDAYVDDKLVVSKKADSMLLHFLNVLYLQMGGLNYVSMPALKVANLNGNTPVWTPYNISAISAGAGGTVRITVTSGYPPTSINGYASIQGVQSSSAIGLVDGLYSYNYISSTQIDLVGSTYVTGDNAKYTANSASARLIVSVANPTRYPSLRSFQFPNIVVGTGTTAVALSDFCLEKEIQSASTAGRLTYNSGVVSLDTDNATSSQITFTRTFTNNSGGAITVNEIGMYCAYGSGGGSAPYDAYQVLIMRDLATIQVDIGKTLTVNYRIKSTITVAPATDPGGFLKIYTKMLYRHFAQAARSAQDINNVARSYSQSPSTLKVVGAGGEAGAITYGGSSAVCTDPSWKQGIVIGMDGATAVSQGDYFVKNVIAHGSGSNQMLHYGSFVQNFTTDSFDIIKTFENNSGAAITVNEIGLVCGADNGGTDNGSNEFPLHLFLLARNTLDTGVEVPDGDILKVTYTIKVVL